MKNYYEEKLKTLIESSKDYAIKPHLQIINCYSPKLGDVK